MNRRPVNNKSNFDPGRFTTDITFTKQVAVGDGSGGSDLTYPVLYTCRAVEGQVRDGDQLAVGAGASVFNNDKWFTIRFNRNFTPTKDMNVVDRGKKYAIKGIIPLDIPVHYYKILCIRQDG